MKIYHKSPGNTLLLGDVLEVLKSMPSKHAQAIVTSPPYWGLRDYGVEGQLGLEKTPEEYVVRVVEIFREARRVLRSDGTLWLNLGDSYAHPNTGGNGATGGRDKSTLQSKMPPINTTPVKKHMPKNLKPKDLVGIPWRVAFALQADGWYLRSDIIWSKPNPMPESVTDRPTKAHEYIFLMSKSEKYYYDHEAIKEPTTWKDDRVRDRETTKLNNVPGRSRMGGLTTNQYDKRNKRSVWTVQTRAFKAAHFAVFPPALISPCILAGAPVDGIVLDPFNGSGTTGREAKRLKRQYIGIDINAEYLDMTIEHENKQEALL